MYLQFYRQKATELKEGFTYYSGEDAQPYVDDHLIIVADGLGGTGAIRHPSINRDVLDEEISMKAFFGDMYEHMDDERFVSYFKRSFKELFLLKDFYGKSTHSYKKSSYFGSRIVSCALLYHTLFDEKLNPEKLFADYAALEEGKRAEFLTSLGDTVTQIIKEDIHKVAENANIFYESKIPRLKVMATTLCSTIYVERDDFVEAFCLYTGDSRPYVWTVEDGLRQVIADQENEDGGMYGCIHDGGNFSISCKYFKFNKPCVLFNASDGCFDSGKFLSPMAFEKLILDAFIESNNIEETEKRFISDFDEYGTHDDSSTLALASFGYASFEELQNDCSRRLDVIKSEYLSKFEGLLEIDYASTLAKRKAEFNRNISMLKKDFESEDCVAKYCEGKVLESGFEKNEIAPEESFIFEAREKIAGYKKDICGLIELDLIAFISSVSGDDKALINDNLVAANANLRKDIIDLTKEYNEKINNMSANFDAAVAKIKGYLEEAKGIDSPQGFDDFRSIEFTTAKKTCDSIMYIREFFDDMGDRNYPLIQKISKKLKKYRDTNKEIIKKYPGLIGRIYDKLLDGFKISPDLLKKKEKIRFVELLRLTVEALAIIADDEKTRKNNALLKARKKYWDSNFIAVIIHFAMDEQSGISEELRTKVRAEKEKLASLDGEFSEKAKAQSELLELYDRKYSEIMRKN